jgi:NAD(P)-dependent dehydrogenase (short-subunit alcohol dehydrogenase family)
MERNVARHAVVTAGTGGIGVETAIGLAKSDYTVTVIGRDRLRGVRAVDRINVESGRECADFIATDLSSLDSVRKLADKLVSRGPISILVNNVGGMFDRQLFSSDGVELTFALNHLSPCLLTELLLDSLEKGGPGRVVSVTSGAIRMAARNFRDVAAPNKYYGLHVYGRAKLAHLMYIADLARRLDGTGISVFAADPGGAITDMTSMAMQSSSVVIPALRPLWPAIRRASQRSTSSTAAEAARSSIIAATAKAFNGKTSVVVGPDGKFRRIGLEKFKSAAVDEVLRLSRHYTSLEARGSHD